MRPNASPLEARRRKDSDRNGLMGPIPLGHNVPTSFRLARGDELEGTTKKEAKTTADSAFGVQSLEDTIDESAHTTQNVGHGGEDEHGNSQGARRRSTLRPTTQDHSRDSSQEGSKDPDPQITLSSPSRPPHEHPSPPSMSHSTTSLSLDSQAPLSSLPSTPKSTSNRSLRPSDEESTDEQAILSSEEEEVEHQQGLHDSAPQLVMPSIKMPSRRPFTERGKAMGRLKVMIAGDSGVGKTTIIKSIVQLCEDIVHVDPLGPNPPIIAHSSSRSPCDKRQSLNTLARQQIAEIFASTKPYPLWWSEVEDTKLLRRRKRIGDTVLERNICFVDTPGYSNGMSKLENMEIVLRYIETQLTKPFSASTANEGDIAGLLSGSGGSQVDVVLYLIAQTLKDEDLAFLQRLTKVTNVIPLIAKSDTQSFEESEMLRRSIDELQHTDIKLFTFRNDSSTLPYSVSSAPADDSETMDASTLMSPDYIQPLLPSELAVLVEHLINPDNAACLRHLAAKKLVHAQGSQIFSMSSTTNPQSVSNVQDQRSTSKATTLLSSNTSRTMTVYSNAVSPYVQAKLSDHTQQQEKLAQVRLAKWANDLQRSLHNERARYEAIARGERAVWLTERLRETANNGALVCTQMTSGDTAKHKGPLAGRHGLLDAGDPLGLFRWNDTVKRRGWIAVQIVGSFGILSAMAVWVARTWRGDVEVSFW